jgi:hypothetical protein
MPVIIRPEDIEREVNAVPAIETNASVIFANHPLRNTTQIAIDEIERELGNIPVVRRGSNGVRPMSESSLLSIEPQPIEIDDTFTAVEVDEYERSTDLGKQQLIDEKSAAHIQVVRSTMRALAAQSLRGTIDYMMQAGASMVRYQVDYGDVPGIQFSDTVTQIDIAKLIVQLQSIAQRIRDNGYGGPIRYIASSDVYITIINAAANQKQFAIGTGEGYIDVSGFRVYADNDTWTDIDSTGAAISRSLMQPGEIMGVAMDAGHKMPFYKIDDVVMRQAIPVYIFTKIREDQRGENLYVKSKPFPMPKRRAICFGKYAV